jgi:hypothetical protein
MVEGHVNGRELDPETWRALTRAALTLGLPAVVADVDALLEDWLARAPALTLTAGERDAVRAALDGAQLDPERPQALERIELRVAEALGVAPRWPVFTPTPLEVPAELVDALAREVRAHLSRPGHDLVRAAADALGAVLLRYGVRDRAVTASHRSARDPERLLVLDDRLAEIVADAPRVHRSKWVADRLAAALGLVPVVPAVPPAPARATPVRIPAAVVEWVESRAEDLRLRAAEKGFDDVREERLTLAAWWIDTLADAAERFHLGDYAVADARAAQHAEPTVERLAARLPKQGPWEERAVRALLEVLGWEVEELAVIEVPSTARPALSHAVQTALAARGGDPAELAGALVEAIVTALPVVPSERASRAVELALAMESGVPVRAPERLVERIVAAAALRWVTPDVGAIDARARAYSPRERYATDDVIEHPRFGRGIVTESTPTHVAVAFTDGSRKLVHGR